MEITKTPPIYIEGETDDYELYSIIEDEVDDSNLSRDENKYSDKVSPRVQKLRDIRKHARVSITQSRPFLAGVELDIKRKHENALLIEDLFIEWCKNGNKTWLSPLEIIAKYDEALLLYNGKRNAIAPFIENLISLSKEGISPHAFLRYVQNPRMGMDFNWRDWVTKHLNSLRLIANILLELKKNSPFDRDRIGTERMQLARDIVIVKYAGKPLARFGEDVLKSGAAIGIYKDSWSKLRFDNTAFIAFLKRNILPILFSLSGKVDLPHINRILILLPELEALFQENFREGYLDSISKDPPGIYGKDFDKGFEERRNKGYKYYDFIVETESFIKILSALLKTQSGYFLLPWIVRLMIGKKDSHLAGKISELIDVLDDTGGNHSYTWHIRKLLAQSQERRDSYIEIVRANNGADPDYPNIQRLFEHPGQTYENSYLIELAGRLGISLSEFGPRGTEFSFKDLMNAYIKKNPDSEKILFQFREDTLRGLDKEWGLQTLSSFDSLGDSVHPLFLRSVIRGLGSNFFSSLKSSSFSNLFKSFTILKKNPFAIKQDFKIPFYEVKNIDKFKAEEISKKVNRKLILDALFPFLDYLPVTADNFIPFINAESISLRDSELIKTDALKNLELELKNLEKEEKKEASTLKEKESQLKKMEKSLLFIREKRSHYEEIISNFHRLGDDEKFLVVLLISGFITEIGTELYKFTVHLLLTRYEKEARLKEQLDYLKQDIVAETLNYSQVSFFLSTIELCRNLLQIDKSLEKIQKDTDHRLHDLLRPYIITKNKKLSSESIDAAINKLTSLGKLTSEKSKWLDILENTERKLKEKFSSFNIFLSKTSLDAYYGDMGGICLANYPGEIIKDGFFVNRLIQKEEEMIVGISIAILSNAGIPSLDIKSYWAAFAFNPLASLINSFSYRNQLYIYLQFRRVLEHLANNTKLPVAIVGVDTFGIVSNHSGFRELILNYEEKKKNPAKRITDANGISLYYDEKNYRKALLIIDPARPETFTAEAGILYYKYPNE